MRPTHQSPTPRHCGTTREITPSCGTSRSPGTTKGFADRQSLARLRRNLLRWYDLNRRHLPWRDSQDPYRVWISEVMLQQTRVQAVIPYYEKFLRLCPTVQTLATADEEKLLACW